MSLAHQLHFNSLCHISNHYYLKQHCPKRIWPRFNTFWNEPLTTIDHWLSLPWSLNLTLTNCLRFTFFNYAYPKLFSAYILIFGSIFPYGSYIPQIWSYLLFGFTYTQNLPTHSHIHSILGRIHIPSNAAIHGHFHVSFNASLRDLHKFMFQTQDIIKPLPWVWEKVLEISLFCVTMCNGIRGPTHGIFHTKFKQFIIYTWKNIRSKILVHFYGSCA